MILPVAVEYVTQFATNEGRRMDRPNVIFLKRHIFIIDLGIIINIVTVIIKYCKLDSRLLNVNIRYYSPLPWSRYLLLCFMYEKVNCWNFKCLFSENTHLYFVIYQIEYKIWLEMIIQAPFGSWPFQIICTKYFAILNTTCFRYEYLYSSKLYVRKSLQF